jgi:hypothetical protein
MSNSKQKRFVRRWPLGVALLLAMNTAAFAGPTTLVCTNEERPSDPPSKIELNEANAVITMVTTAQQYAPASSTTYPAVFTPQEIKFVWGGTGNQWDETIDRLTGIITIVAESDHSVVLHNHCDVGAAQF